MSSIQIHRTRRRSENGRRRACHHRRARERYAAVADGSVERWLRDQRQMRSNANDTLTFTPNPGFVGTDQVKYIVTDMGRIVGEPTVRRKP